MESEISAPIQDNNIYLFFRPGHYDICFKQDYEKINPNILNEH